MWEWLKSSGPLWIALLVASPWLGVLITAWAGRTSSGAARRSALANAVVTALLSTLLVGLMVSLQQSDPAVAIPRGFQIPWWTSTVPAASSPPWSVEVVVSLGIESVNQPLLLVLPWLVVAALILTPRETPPLFYVGLLVTEGVGLVHFAAQDAITCLLAAELVMGANWLLTGWYGASDRRSAAQRYLSAASAGQRFWWFALLALALAAVWVQLEFRREPLAVQFGWSQFEVILPRFVSRYVSSFEYWAVTSSLIVLAFGWGVLLRGPLVPFHTWLAIWIQEVPPALAVLHFGAFGLIAAALYLHALAPIWAFFNAVPFAWGLYGGAATAILAGLLTLAQTDLRKLVTYAWLSGQGWAWMGISLGTAAEVRAGWFSLISSALGYTSLLGVVLVLESRYQTREMDAFGGLSRKCPRLTVIGCLVAWLAVIGPWFPRSAEVWTWQAGLLRQAPRCWMLGMVGQLLVAWATIWLIQRLFFGRLREPLHDPRFFATGATDQEPLAWHTPQVPQVLIADLTVAEGMALLLPVVLQLVITGFLAGSPWP